MRQRICNLGLEKRPTQIAADLATPRWYAARFAQFGYNSSSVRSKNAKPVNKSLGHFDYAKDFEVTYVHTDTRLH